MALSERKATFLAKDAWITLPYQLSIKSAGEVLLDFLLRIPGLLDRADNITRLSSEEVPTEAGKGEDQSHEAMKFCHISKFFQDCDGLVQEADSWMENLQKSEVGPLWWYSKTNCAAAETSLPLKRESYISLSKGKINFARPNIASLLITYWGSMLELSSAIIEVRDLLYNSHMDSVPPLDSIYSSVSMPKDRPTKYALRIYQTAMYLSSGLEGCTIAYGSLLLAAKHFRKQHENAKLNCNGISLAESKEQDVNSLGIACCKQALGILLKTMHCGNPVASSWNITILGEDGP